MTHCSSLVACLRRRASPNQIDQHDDQLMTINTGYEHLGTTPCQLPSEGSFYPFLHLILSDLLKYTLGTADLIYSG